MRKRTNVLSIPLIAALLLTLAGCGEKAPGNKTETVAPDAQVKELTPEEKFAKLQNEAEAGNAAAQNNLGLAYANGKGVPKDAAKAVEWYQKAVAQGHAGAQFGLGWMYRIGEGVPEDDAKAVEWFQKAAAQGNADAQASLGDMYAYGLGIVKDEAKAIEWYQKAAAQGHAEAQAGLGDMYRFGKGVPKDAAKAIEWYQKAAAQGYASASYQLGQMYALKYMIEGVPEDEAKAVEWFHKAAEQGGAFEQRDLGAMYFNGSGGVPKDKAKAFEWFQKAAAQDDVDAQLSLGSMYADGEGVTKDDAKAVEWFQKAAAQGYSRGQDLLGFMYSEGRGVTRDLVRAYAWFNLAAAQDNENAKRNRGITEAKLTPAQRAEGQRLAANWKRGDTLQASNDSQPGQTSVGGTPSKQSTGTAFAVSTSGHALTNHHVINGCTEVKVAGREGIAKVITSDSVNDLALLQLPGKIKDIAVLNPDPAKLRQGEDIIVFGYPLNAVLSSGGNLTPGTISALTGLGNNTNQIQITAPIQPGSSGSPVLDKQGNVIGVVSMKLDDVKTALATGSIPQNVNFAVNGQTVKAFLDANKVPYKTGGGFFSREKSNADIAEEASKWSVLVECWK